MVGTSIGRGRSSNDFLVERSCVASVEKNAMSCSTAVKMPILFLKFSLLLNIDTMGTNERHTV